MVFKPELTTIAFFPPSTKSWMGGVNFYCNLFYALEKTNSANFKVLVFLEEKCSQDVVNMYKTHNIQVVYSRALNRFSLSGIFDRLSYKVIGKRPLLNKQLKQHHVSVVSHVVCDMGVDCRQIGWIPDFQHLHLTKMFSSREIQSRNRSFHRIAAKAHAVVLSSYDALKDFKAFTKSNASKGCVAQFVSQPPAFYHELSNVEQSELAEKYRIDRPYIYVPNQFWQHKNHDLLVQAVLLLKQKGFEPLILCSGLMEDYRDTTYIDKLNHFITQNNITDNIKFLGLIPYKDVFSLIKFSEVVLNPSKFEGWSSTVEECKSVGKPMLLSDIPVHKEQYPDAIFFKVQSEQDLADKIEYILYSDSTFSSVPYMPVQQRTQIYAETYTDIVEKVLKI